MLNRFQTRVLKSAPMRTNAPIWKASTSTNVPFPSQKPTTKEPKRNIAVCLSQTFLRRNLSTRSSIVMKSKIPKKSTITREKLNFSRKKSTSYKNKFTVWEEMSSSVLNAGSTCMNTATGPYASSSYLKSIMFQATWLVLANELLPKNQSNFKKLTSWHPSWWVLKCKKNLGFFWVRWWSRWAVK